LRGEADTASEAGWSVVAGGWVAVGWASSSG
jgi:hypothetical protein